MIMEKGLRDFIIARCWYAYREASEGNYHRAAGFCREAAATDEKTGEKLETIYLNFERGNYSEGMSELANFFESLIIAERKVR